jgi:hypothetical protein
VEAFLTGRGTVYGLEPRGERGLASFNATHIASLSWIADLPLLTGQPAALRLVAGGWQWNGLFSARTGLSLNPTMGGGRGAERNRKPETECGRNVE